MKRNTFEDSRKWIVLVGYFITSIVIPIFISVITATLRIETPVAFGYWMLAAKDIIILMVCLVVLSNDLRVELKKDSLKRVLVMTGIFFFAFFFMNAVASCIHSLIGIDISSSQNQQIIAEMKSELPDILFYASSVVIGPASEELVFRFTLYNLIKKVCGTNKNASLIAVLGSSICFGIMHSGFDITIFPYFLIGVFFCIGYLYSNNILPVIIVHSINNIIAIGAL